MRNICGIFFVFLLTISGILAGGVPDAKKIEELKALQMQKLKEAKELLFNQREKNSQKIKIELSQKEDDDLLKILFLVKKIAFFI